MEIPADALIIEAAELTADVIFEIIQNTVGKRYDRGN